MSAQVFHIPEPESRPDKAIDETVDEHRTHTALIAEIGKALAGAGIDAATSAPRSCPVCLTSDSAPDFRAPVYAFHRCRGCSLLFTPRLIHDEVVRARYRDTALARAYRQLMRLDAEHNDDPEVHAALLDPCLELVPSRGCAIDVGCGFGRMVAALRPRFDEAIGLELDEQVAREAQVIHGVDARAVRLEELDRPPASVDLIVFNQVLDHIADLGSLLSAAYRLLRPGGVIYVGVPHGDSLGMKMRAGAHPFVATHRHLNLFTMPSLRALARATGFLVRDLRSDDDLDLSAMDWALGHVPDGATPAFAIDRLARAFARKVHLPSRLNRGAHLTMIASKGA